MRMAMTVAALCLALGMSLSSEAQAIAKKHTQIPAQGLGPALQTLAKDRGLQVLYVTEEINRHKTNGASGDLTPDEALKQLLEGTGLTYRYLGENSVAIEPVSAASAVSSSDTAEVTRSLRLVQTAAAADITEPPQESENRAHNDNDTSAGDTAADKKSRKETAADFVVTGSRIKGVQDQFSPVTSVSRDDMDMAGFENVFDAVDSLPQNFGGGVSFDTTPANSFEGPGGASVNLRGLGNHATLILLNGRRIAPGGIVGDFGDISSIPVSAIERMEVMTDGASAIYGSDAIAGVVNVILRKDFSGAESRLNLGTIDGGGGDTLKAGQTFGWHSERSNGLLTYEYSSEDELNARQKSFAQKAGDPTWLLPSNRKHNVFASGGAGLTDSLSLSADSYYNKRDTHAFTSEPFFQSEQIQEVEQYGGALGLNMRLAGSWEGDLTGVYSRNDRLSDAIFPSFGLHQILQSQAEVASADASAGGSLFQIAGKDVKGVFGAHYRTENIHGLQSDFFTGDPLWSLDGSRHVKAVYGEIYAPLIAESDARRGINRLAVTLAARHDSYSDVGSSFDPKVGVAWSPVSGLNLRGTWGTAFRAPRLEQLVDAIDSAALGVYVDPESPTGTSVALSLSGEKPDIDPEQATIWTVGFDYKLGGLQLRGTYFNIDYTDRVAEPFANFDTESRWIDFPSIPVRNPSQETVQQYVDAAAYYYDYGDFYPNLGDLQLSDVTVILDSRDQNLSASKAEGFDVEISYDLDAGNGDWMFSLNSSFLTKFTQQFAPLAPTLDLIDTINNPVGLKMRGGLGWRVAPVATAVYVNYVDSYEDTAVPGGPQPISSWTTVDASMRLELGEFLRSNSFAKGASLSFYITNLLDNDPPELAEWNLRTAFYDPANSDPTGRRFGMLLSKQW